MDVLKRLQEAGVVDTDSLYRELRAREAENRKVALAFARERYAEYAALEEERKRAEKKLAKSIDNLEKMLARKGELEGSFTALALAEDEAGQRAAREDYRGLVEKYIPNGERYVERDRAAYDKTQYDPKRANAELIKDMELIASTAGYNPKLAPSQLPEEGLEIVAEYVEPAKRRMRNYIMPASKRTPATTL